MTSGVLGVLGGLGLFLIGMTIMTDGLKSLAGGALRNALARFTKSPLTGAATGAIGTAVLQSSSATTVMAVGFAGAGLITFSQSLGIIFGANIGTTITGWLVALLGFKLHLTQVVTPLVFLGAMMRLFGKRHVAAVGYGLAGFGLIFIGISVLQSAMEGFGDFVTPQSFPPNTVFGRLLLVLIGVAITLVTQSSSAGVATAITAVHVGTISLPQAAAMVIGMNVGTTFTAAIAAIGGAVDARRTGIAHVVYNLMIGVGAFLFLPVFVDGWNAFAPNAFRGDAEIALVSFHTLFNTLGVVLVLPFTSQFAQLIVRLVPTYGSELTRRLERSLLSHTDVALDAVDATLQEIARVTFRTLSLLLVKSLQPHDSEARLDELKQAAKETHAYLGQIETSIQNRTEYGRNVAAWHAVDHLTRLVRRCRKQKRLNRVFHDRELSDFGRKLSETLVSHAESDMTTLNSILEPFWLEIDRRIEPYRRETIQRTASGAATTEQALASLDGVRWLRRVCYHVWRITYHLDPSVSSELTDENAQRVMEDVPEERG